MTIRDGRNLTNLRVALLDGPKAQRYVADAPSKSERPSMNEPNESDEPEEPFGFSALQESLRRHLEDAKAVYEQNINRLWAGNAGGVFAVLGALAAAKAPTGALLIAFGAFVLGLFFLALRALSSLVSQARMIRALEEANSILDVEIGRFQRPSEANDLSFSNSRTIMALLSGVTFLGGIIAFGLSFVSAIHFGWFARMRLVTFVSIAAATAGVAGTISLFAGSFAYEQLGGYADKKLVGDVSRRNKRRSILQRVGLSLILASFVLQGIATIL